MLKVTTALFGLAALFQSTFSAEAAYKLYGSDLIWPDIIRCTLYNGPGSVGEPRYSYRVVSFHFNFARGQTDWEFQVAYKADGFGDLRFDLAGNVRPGGSPNFWSSCRQKHLHEMIDEGWTVNLGDTYQVLPRF